MDSIGPVFDFLFCLHNSSFCYFVCHLVSKYSKLQYARNTLWLYIKVDHTSICLVPHDLNFLMRTKHTTITIVIQSRPTHKIAIEFFFILVASRSAPRKLPLSTISSTLKAWWTDQYPQGGQRMQVTSARQKYCLKTGCSKRNL